MLLPYQPALLFVCQEAEGGNVGERLEGDREPKCVSLTWLDVGGVPGQATGLAAAEVEVICVSVSSPTCL